MLCILLCLSPRASRSISLKVVVVVVVVVVLVLVIVVVVLVIVVVIYSKYVLFRKSKVQMAHLIYVVK